MKATFTILFLFSVSLLFASPPVKWGDFSAVQQKNYIHLSWSTLSENNSKLFVVQRSQDASTWRSIAEMPAEQLAADYFYIDKTPLPDVNYYRIKQIDMNGDFSYSQTVFVAVTNINPVKIQPNPATAFVKINNVSVGNIVKVVDAQGTLKIEQEITSSAFILETAFLSKGIYFVSFEDKFNKVINTQKLIIQ